MSSSPLPHSEYLHHTCSAELGGDVLKLLKHFFPQTLITATVSIDADRELFVLRVLWAYMACCVYHAFLYLPY